MALPLQFRLNPTDRAGFYDRPFFQRLTATLASASITVSYQVPNDSMLLLQNWAWDYSGGGGQTVDGIAIYVADRSGTAQSYLVSSVIGTARTTGDRQHAGLWIPRSSILTFLGAFSAGVAANSVSGYVAGMLTAHGNFPAI